MLIELLLILLFDFEDFDLGSLAQKGLKLLTLFHLVKYQLELVGLHRTVGQHQLLCEGRQLLDRRRGEDRVDCYPASERTYLKAFYSIFGMTLPSRGHVSSRQGFVLASISQTLKFSSTM